MAERSPSPSRSLQDLPLIEDLLSEDPLIDDPLIEDPLIDDPLIEDLLSEDPLIDDPLIEDPLIGPLLDGPLIGRMGGQYPPVPDDRTVQEIAAQEAILRIVTS